MELKLNHRYLVTGFLSGITELKCIEITESSCKIQFGNGNTLWEPKNRIKYWDQVEDLGKSNFLKKQINEQIKLIK